MNTQSARRALPGALASALLLALAPAAPAGAAEIHPREVAEYRTDFPGTSRTQAEARLATQQKGAGIVNQLRRDLGPDYAGVWFDNDSGEFVVAVLPGADRGSVHAELAGAKLEGSYRTSPATHSWEELKEAHERIDAALLPLIEGGLAQTSLDPRTNAVVVHLADGADRARRGEVQSIAAGEGVRVDVRDADAESLATEFAACKTYYPRHCDPPLRGGVAITSGEAGSNPIGACTAGFKAVGKTYGNRFVLTAGHCLSEGWFWRAHTASEVGHDLGLVTDYDFPGGDWAKILANGEWWDTSPWPSMVVHYWGNQSTPIYYEAYSYLGQYVCFSGNKSGTSCGNVSALDVTDSEEGATVYNLTKFGQACIDFGDSGGPIFAGNTALGIMSAKTGSGCSATGYYSEITNVTDDMGVTVGTRIGGAPGADTDPATNIQPYQAKLNGEVNPNSVETSYRFEWGKSCYCQSTSEGNAGHGANWVSKSATITGLDPVTKYKFRIRAKSAAGTAYGSEATFTTPPAPPKVTTEPHSNVRVEEEDGKATLHGKVNPGGADTDWRFEWGTVASGEFANKAPVPDGDAGDGIDFKSVQAPIEGLKGSTEYHYRLYAENSEGDDTGSVKKFTTPDWRPQVTAGDLGPAGPYVADETGKIRLDGVVNPNGFATSFHFEWATQEEFEAEEFNNSAPGVEVGNCICEEEIEQVIEGLKGSTTYHYRLVASNVEGAKDDVSSETFKTYNWAPHTGHLDATGVGADEATLTASVVPDGFATTYRFEWATQEEFEAEEYGHVIEGEEPVTTTFDDGSGVEVSAPISGLTRWDTYHFRVVVESVEGAHTTGDHDFITSTGGFKATDYPTAVTATPEGPFVISMAGAEVSCTPPTLEATIEGGGEFQDDGNDSLTTSSTSSFECETPIGPWTMEMNGCSFQLDPGYGTKSSFQGELNIGPPGCGPVDFGNDWCKISIPPQIGRDVTFLNEGEGTGQKVRATVDTGEEVRYEEEGGGLCAGASRADGSIYGVWKLEGESQAEEAAGVRVSPFVRGGPGATAEVIEVGATSALLGLTIVPLEQDAGWEVNYGTTESYGTSVGGDDIKGGEGPVEVEAEIDGLDPDTTYHYRVVTWNQDGITEGEGQTFTTEAFHSAQFAATEYPATIAGANSVPVEFEIEEPEVKFECETAALSGSMSEGTSSLSLAPALSGTEEEPAAEHCQSSLGQTLVKPNSCEFVFDVDKAPSPYTGGLSVACAEEGDEIEFLDSSGCTIGVPAQTPGGSLAYGDAEGKVSAEGQATGVKYNAPGFVCGLGGLPAEGENSSLMLDASLGAENEAEEAADLFIDPASEVSLSVVGEEASESNPPRIVASEYPTAVFGANSVPVEFEIEEPEVKFECETAALSGSMSEGTSSLSLAPALSGTEEEPAAEHCQSSLGQTTVVPNSCELVFGVDDAGPPHSGGLSVACAEEGDEIEFLDSSGCTIGVPAQTPGGSLAYGDAEGKVSAEGQATGVKYNAPGFVCGLGGLPAEGEDGVLAVDASLSGIYAG